MDHRERYKEWYFQSDYDLETAVDMFKSGRTVYCIFMCHFILGKSVKRVVNQNNRRAPIKIAQSDIFCGQVGFAFE